MIAFGSVARWLALALLGLVIAAAVAFAASRLVSQRIGLASEPLNAGRELAPPAAHEGRGKPESDHHGSRTTSTATTPTTSTAPTTPTAIGTAPSSPPPDSSSSEASGGDD